MDATLERLKDVVPVWVWVVVPIALLVPVMLVETPKERAVREQCDAAVDTLLNSRDVVEIQRAGILIDALRCNVGRRLPR